MGYYDYNDAEFDEFGDTPIYDGRGEGFISKTNGKAGTGAVRLKPGYVQFEKNGITYSMPESEVRNASNNSQGDSGLLILGGVVLALFLIFRK